MNRYIDILNHIRKAADHSWLTPGQEEAYKQLMERWKFLDEVNLWGEPGSGKTFIGWVLHKQSFANYAPALKEVPRSSSFSKIIVDNCSWYRRDIRETLSYCRSLGYHKVVLITSEPAQDQIASIQVRLFPQDLEKAAQNLQSVCKITSVYISHTLWDLVSPLRLDIHNDIIL